MTAPALVEATAAERQQRLARLVADGQVTDASRVHLFPLLVGGGNGHHTVLRRDTGQMIATSEEGIAAIKLMQRGLTLAGVRRALGAKYRCEPASIDLSELLDAMAIADLLKAVDAHAISTTTTPLLWRVRLRLAAGIGARATGVLLRRAPLWVTLLVLYRWRPRRHQNTVAQIAVNLRATPALDLDDQEARVRARSNYDLTRRVRLDQLLLAALPPPRLDRWIRTRMEIAGTAHLDRARAAGTGVILCGCHAGSYNLVPFMLGSRLRRARS